LEHRPQDEQLADHATPLQSDGRGSRTAGHHRSGDGLLLAELAGLDELLRERGGAWKELVGRLLLQRLPASVSLAYQSLVDAGRLPAIAAVAKGVCGGCESPLTEPVIEALSRGAVAVCARCERLLRPCEGG